MLIDFFNQAPEHPKSAVPQFGSCEELWAHGVEMNAHYLIDGEQKYCKDSWSKIMMFILATYISAPTQKTKNM